jgi:hypothetical protein
VGAVPLLLPLLLLPLLLPLLPLPLRLLLPAQNSQRQRAAAPVEVLRPYLNKEPKGQLVL